MREFDNRSSIVARTFRNIGDVLAISPESEDLATVNQTLEFEFKTLRTRLLQVEASPQTEETSMAIEQLAYLTDGVATATEQWDAGRHDYAFVYLLQRAALAAQAKQPGEAQRLFNLCDRIVADGFFADFTTDAGDTILRLAEHLDWRQPLHSVEMPTLKGAETSLPGYVQLTTDDDIATHRLVMHGLKYGVYLQAFNTGAPIKPTREALVRSLFLRSTEEYTYTRDQLLLDASAL